MSSRFNGLRPPYPVYSRTPYTGDLPPPSALGPPDTRPSSTIPHPLRATNPAYSVYAGAHGRHLAGLNGVQMHSADEGIKDYPNELDVLQIADDVVGNGMFDPPGSHGNVHPDYGVFADHESLPGYIARDQFYTPSEVIDATTGSPVMYVPSGAVSIDHAQQQAFKDRLLWQLPPGVNPYATRDVFQMSTVTPHEAAWPVGQAEEPPEEKASPLNMFLIAGIAGLSIGLVAALVWKKK